jgi:hypothetical protein
LTDALGPDGSYTKLSWWAPAIRSGPCTAALLAELGRHTQHMASWTAQLTRTRPGNAHTSTSAILTLRNAQPWLAAAGTAIVAAQQAHYPLPARSLLDAIPASTPPRRQEPGATPVQLSRGIALTAERLRSAAFTFATSRQWSPAATSPSWRRDALASAITGHASEIVLRTLADRAGQLGHEPAFQAQLSNAADTMGQTWKAWRAVTSQWDVLSTGTSRGSDLSPVASEIQDLVLQTGRVAYNNNRWTPSAAAASVPRVPQDLAESTDECRRHAGSCPPGR